MTFDCVVCLGVNHAKRLHCEYCGTIPAQYSIIKKPAVVKTDEFSSTFVEIVVAYGAERIESHRASKHYARTVAFDYYAEPEDAR